MKISKEVKTAILVLTGIALLIFGINYLRGENILGSSRVYYVEYDNVEGLVNSTPVTINGLNVGKVLDITFKEDGSGDLLVKLLVENDYEFSKNSTAELYEAGLIGGKAIAILPAFDKAANAEDGDTLKGSVKAGLSELVNQKLSPLQENIERMTASADKLLQNLNDVFNDNTKVNIRKSLSDLKDILGNVKDASKSIDVLVISNKDKLNNSLANVENITTNLSKVSDSIAEVNIGETFKNLESTLKNFDGILANLEKGEGSMGKLLKDDDLYNNLEGATQELESLLLDFKLHPNRYTRILSKKEIPYQEPETK